LARLALPHQVVLVAMVELLFLMLYLLERLLDVLLPQAVEAEVILVLVLLAVQAVVEAVRLPPGAQEYQDKGTLVQMLTHQA
jgi:hypothetical protein